MTHFGVSEWSTALNETDLYMYSRIQFLVIHIYFETVKMLQINIASGRNITIHLTHCVKSGQFLEALKHFINSKHLHHLCVRSTVHYFYLNTHFFFSGVFFIVVTCRGRKP